jgi:hypothetical protein
VPSRQRGVELLEGLEDSLQLLGGNADPGVPHLDPDHVPQPTGAHPVPSEGDGALALAAAMERAARRRR